MPSAVAVALTRHGDVRGARPHAVTSRGELRGESHAVGWPGELPPIGLGDVRGEPPVWHERALCAQTDPEAFFPEKGHPAEPAKRICARCPVRTDCLTDAINHHELFGIWGGLTAHERRHLTPTPERNPDL